MIIARPQPGEAAPYYFKYIDQVGPTGIVETLRSQLEEFGVFSSRIAEEQSLHRYASGKWSIREVLGHINDTERVFTFRALWFARGFETSLPSFEQDLAVMHAEADRFPWRQHVEEFLHVRRGTIALFENMPREAWARRGIASENPFTVRALAFVVAGHFAHHMRILSERYL